jgi:hypothetical protein
MRCCSGVGSISWTTNDTRETAPIASTTSINYSGSRYNSYLHHYYERSVGSSGGVGVLWIAWFPLFVGASLPTTSG